MLLKIKKNRNPTSPNKPRRLMMSPNDPLLAYVAEFRGKFGGNSRFFGLGINCQNL